MSRSQARRRFCLPLTPRLISPWRFAQGYAGRRPTDLRPLGLDPQVGAETEFFADRVDYFGERGVTREKIRRDLQRYNDRWPQRGFWLAGELEVSRINEKLKVAFPLRYELQNGPKRAAGKVLKTLVLEKTGADDLQIVAVNERKTR